MFWEEIKGNFSQCLRNILCKIIIDGLTIYNWVCFVPPPLIFYCEVVRKKITLLRGRGGGEPFAMLTQYFVQIDETHGFRARNNFQGETKMKYK